MTLSGFWILLPRSHCSLQFPLPASAWTLMLQESHLSLPPAPPKLPPRWSPLHLPDWSCQPSGRSERLSAECCHKSYQRYQLPYESIHCSHWYCRRCRLPDALHPPQVHWPHGWALKYALPMRYCCLQAFRSQKRRLRILFLPRPLSLPQWKRLRTGGWSPPQYFRSAVQSQQSHRMPYPLYLPPLPDSG